jgi:hypothetical protein
MRASVLAAVTFSMVLWTTGCDLLDPARPAAQPDTEVFGNLLEVERDSDDPSRWIARIQVSPPRALRSAEEERGKPTPVVAKGMVATVAVGRDAVVIADDRPVSLEEIDSGTEVVVLPVAGTTVLRGSTDLSLEAQLLIDFATYRLWRLPKLPGDQPVEINDPARINSSGSELAPVPVGDGSTLYFSASLRPPATDGETWHGAIRDGLAVPEPGTPNFERSYRTELDEDGWSMPELVTFPNLVDAARVRVTWVDPDETRCLVTVERAGEPPWVGVSTRTSAQSPWGEVEQLEELGMDAADAAYLAGSVTKLVFSSSREGRERPDLFLYEPDAEQTPLPLQPEICTFGSEWNPRTGPVGELYFCREDRQLAFKDGQVRSVRLPGPHRILMTQGARTADGAWFFFCSPRYRPLVLDQDIYVASIADDLTLGEPVPVDLWRPAPSTER